MSANSADNLGGCFTCRHPLSETQAAEAEQRFQSGGRTTTRCGNCLVIEFSDGFDGWFVRVVSDDAPGQPVAGAPQIVAEFLHLDERRRLVLAGLRRHAAAHGISLRENASAQWDIQSGASTSGIHVGPALTRLVAQWEAGEALAELVANNWLPKLTTEQAARLVQSTEPLPEPVPWKSDEQTERLFGAGILALDCRGLETDKELPREPSALLETLAPTRCAPGQQVVNQLVERLGRWRFSLEIMGRGKAQLEFTDKFDHYVVHPRSKKLARAIARDGIEATVERLAAEFARLDQARTRTLDLLGGVMADAGYFRDEEGDSWWFGKTHRLAKLEHGRSLTLALRHLTPEQLIHVWLTKNRVLPVVPNEAELAARQTTQFKKLPRRWLPGQPPETWDRLPEMSGLEGAKLDRRAADAIAEALNEARVEPGVSRISDNYDLLSLVTKPFWYRSGDAWASESFWQEYATEAWNGARRQLAAVLLTRAGHIPADLDVDRMVSEFEEYCSEAFEDGFLWQFVDRLPWPIDQGEYPVVPVCFRPRPPQVVRRAVTAFRAAFAQHTQATSRAERWHQLERALTELAKADRQSAEAWLGATEVHELEEHLRRWAGECDFAGNDWDSAFSVAAEFDWRWLPAALADNPLFIPAQFYMEGRYEAPGKLALKLSWVEPGSLAARFAAHALRELSLEVLEQRARSIGGGPDFYESGRKIVRNWLTIDRFAAAIAWQRCRNAGIIAT